MASKSMPLSAGQDSVSRPRWIACWAVHLYTASGAVAAFAALLAIGRGDVRSAFLWLYLAMFIDSSDGTLARLAEVKRYLPSFDGSKLDDLIDYLTFVMVPLVLMVSTGMLAGHPGLAAAGAALLASAYRFCHADAKTPDHYFTGFPSYWNVVALYLYVFDAAPALNAAITGTLAALVFAPLRFVYPSRMTRMRAVTIGLGILWGAAVLGVLVSLPDRAHALAGVSLLYPFYYTVLSFSLQWQGRRGATTGATR